jgi:hypothetical protein
LAFLPVEESVHQLMVTIFLFIPQKGFPIKSLENLFSKNKNIKKASHICKAFFILISRPEIGCHPNN